MSEKAGEPTYLQLAVRRAVEQSGKTRDHFDSLLQKKLGTKGKPIYDIDRGRNRNPGIGTIQAIAEVLGLPLDAFLGAPDITPPRPDQPFTRSADAGETVEIVQLDLSLPMGPGATIDDYIEEEVRLFDLAYIRSFTKTPPQRLRLARGVGDSMFPTLLTYDLVWIDSTQHVLNRSDSIWAVSINGGAAIKRLRPLQGGRRILVMSDNPGPGHESYEVDADDVRIAGRVIRFARDL